MWWPGKVNPRRLCDGDGSLAYSVFLCAAYMSNLPNCTLETSHFVLVFCLTLVHDTRTGKRSGVGIGAKCRQRFLSGSTIQVVLPRLSPGPDSMVSRATRAHPYLSLARHEAWWTQCRMGSCGGSFHSGSSRTAAPTGYVDALPTVAMAVSSSFKGRVVLIIAEPEQPG